MGVPDLVVCRGSFEFMNEIYSGHAGAEESAFTRTR